MVSAHGDAARLTDDELLGAICYTGTEAYRDLRRRVALADLGPLARLQLEPDPGATEAPEVRCSHASDAADALSRDRARDVARSQGGPPG